MKIICTICSKNKNTGSGVLPAYQRYSSDRIRKIKKLSDTSGLPFYILSGKFGLISSEKMIPYYDYLLKIKDIETLSQKVAEQIRKNNISEIELHLSSLKIPEVKNYIETLRKATLKNTTSLTLVVE